jgi:hypothetical protein
MSISSVSIVLSVALGVSGLTSCAGPAASRAGTSEFYWSAALETYAAGDYPKTADHLERLIGDDGIYRTRAIPFYLVLTSGMADGYMQLADQYTAGARVNKSKALAFRLKAAEYRNTASRLALRFAQSVDKIDLVPLGRMPLAFPLPGGNAAPPAVFLQIGGGIELSPADAATAEWLTIQRAVLMTACLAAGAPNDVAKTEIILRAPAAATTRDTFGKAIAQMLKTESSMYSRDKLDEPEKLAAFQERGQKVLAEAVRVGSARLVPAGSIAPLH